jgi:DNA (cytosine-5)-methyltransferase 1
MGQLPGISPAPQTCLASLSCILLSCITKPRASFFFDYARSAAGKLHAVSKVSILLGDETLDNSSAEMREATSQTRSMDQDNIAVRSYALHAAKVEIACAQKTVSNAMFEMFETVHRLRQQHFEAFIDIETWLKVECRISDEDIATYENFETVLGNHKQLLSDNSVAFDTIKALVRADSETRDSAISLLKTGNNVSPGAIRSMAKTLKLGKMSSRQRRARDQQLFFRRKSHEQGQALVSPLQAEARELYAILLRDASRPAGFYERSDELATEDDEYRIKAARKDISERARRLLTHMAKLEILSSIEVENWLEVGVTNPIEQNLAEAQHALEILANSPWVQPGTQVYQSNEYYWAVEDGVFHLTGLSSKSPRRSGTTRPAEALTSLELCAGIGGEAIGLMAAGFKTLALYDNNAQAVDTMKANWADWNPVQQSISTAAGRAEILHYRGKLDLLAGGLPCQPFSRGGKHRGEFDTRQQFDAAAYYVKELQPRAFAFENVVGFNNPKHTDFRRRLEGDFESLDYDVTLFPMDAADYGLAQNRTRLVLVGLKRGSYVREFRPPALVNPFRRGFGDTIADLVFPFRSKDGEKRSPKQKAYDKWAADWLGEHKDDRAPTLTHRRTHDALEQTWKIKGFRSELRSSPMGLDDFGGLPFLTTAILKRIQGIPAEWEIAGEINPLKASGPIANVFPPVLARAVGLRIREALTGEPQDLDQAMAEPIIDVSLIGDRRKVFDFQSSWKRFTKPSTPLVQAKRWKRDILLEQEERDAIAFIGQSE